MEMRRYQSRLEKGFECKSRGEMFWGSVRVRRGEFSSLRVSEKNSEVTFRNKAMWPEPVELVGL